MYDQPLSVINNTGDHNRKNGINWYSFKEKQRGLYAPAQDPVTQSLPVPSILSGLSRSYLKLPGSATKSAILRLISGASCDSSSSFDQLPAFRFGMVLVSVSRPSARTEPFLVTVT